MIPPKIRLFFQATKPGLVKANVLTAIAGLFFAGVDFSLTALIGVISGTTLLVAAGCVINNLFDRDIDQRMERTRSRPSSNGALSSHELIGLSAILASLGLYALFTLTTTLCAIVGLAAYISYGFIYTFLKRKTPLAVPFGTLPGAAGLVVGYMASGSLNGSDIFLLFCLMFFWQIAHFYAIGLRRKKDYQSAQIPTPAIAYKPSTITLTIKVSIVLFFVSLVTVLFQYRAGVILSIFAAVACLWWLTSALQKSQNSEQWAKAVFVKSLVVLPFSTALLAVSGLIRILG